MIGLGTESDEAFIIDAETNIFLYCLEGHKNFVSSIIFDEQINNDEDQIEPNDDMKNCLNNSNMDTIITEYNSNPGNNTTNLNSNKLLSSQTLGANSFNSLHKMPIRQVNQLELLKNFQEDAEISNINQLSNKVFDLKQLRRTRSYINNPNTQTHEEKECRIYDVYTSGYDGFLGVWRIEYFYENDSVNISKNFVDLNINSKDNSQIKKLSSPKITQLCNSLDKIIFYTDFVKIQNIPIFTLRMIDNMIVLIGKRNNIGSSVFLKFFHGIIKSDDIEKNLSEKKISEESYNHKNNVDTKYQELKQSSVKASHYEVKEREAKDTRDRRSDQKDPYVSDGNITNKSPKKEKRRESTGKNLK